jgi:outer membrane autotransporter protein
MKTDGGRAKADVRSWALALYGGKEIELGPGTLRLTLSGIFGTHDLDTRRSVLVGSLEQTLTAKRRARSFQAILEAAYATKVSLNLTLEGYLAAGWHSIWMGGFSERGGSAALKSGKSRKSFAFSEAGIRATYKPSKRAEISFKAGWRRRFGSSKTLNHQSFVAGGDSMGIAGIPLSRNEAVVGVSAGYRLSKNSTLSLSYEGAFGRRKRSHAGAIMFTYTW